MQTQGQAGFSLEVILKAERDFNSSLYTRFAKVSTETNKAKR